MKALLLAEHDIACSWKTPCDILLSVSDGAPLPLSASASLRENRPEHDIACQLKLALISCSQRKRGWPCPLQRPEHDISQPAETRLRYPTQNENEGGLTPSLWASTISLLSAGRLAGLKSEKWLSGERARYRKRLAGPHPGEKMQGQRPQGNTWKF